MAKTFYSEYVGHCMRFYARHTLSEKRSEADELNWKACHDALQMFSNEDQQMLVDVYNHNTLMKDAVTELSEQYCIREKTLWKIIKDLERRIAKKRGLI